MSKVIENQIKRIYNKIFKEVFTHENSTKLINGFKMEIELDVLKMASSEKYQEFAFKFAKALAAKGLSSQRGIWRKYFQAAREAHHIGLPKTYQQFEYSAMKAAIENNFEMIKSIPKKIIEVMNHKYTSALIEEVVKGTKSRGSFRKMLEKHGHTNAGVIARTEAAKLQTVILQTRATNLGSVVYEWLSSNDQRTRPSHKAMNGVIVFWSHQKPLLDNMRGHAGEFPNCRCSPEPILDEDDLTKSSYKVYNFNTDSIVTMSRSELLELIENEK